MTILSIRTVGDPVLRSECQPITVFDKELATLIDNMLETMYDVEGVGLAGPQVGIDKQIFTYGGIDDREGYIINPVLETGEETQEGGEGCLSVPGIKSETPRKNWARVRGVDRHGNPLELEVMRTIRAGKYAAVAGKTTAERATRVSGAFGSFGAAGSFGK